MIALVGTAAAQTFGSSDYFVETVATNLSQPTTMAFVGSDTFLICEKETGRVKRVVNGVVEGIALDLAVSTTGERGLLGICLHPNFATNGFVYAYYSRAPSDGGSWVDNRIDRFRYNDGILSFNAGVASFPVDPNQANGPIHNGGIILIGPDDKLYAITGDLNRGRLSNPRIEQNSATELASGVGGIHRYNLDGTIPLDNPFVLHPDPKIRTMWAYGVRNSFGMTVDPLSGRIWFTENGPNNYDEVNVVPEPGMNSGWLKIIGPDSRNAEYSENGFNPYDADDLTELPSSYYRDPEFSWLSTIGPTSILFLTSAKMGEAERNHCLIGDTNNGDLYLFEMDPHREHFDLDGPLSDRVADNSGERGLNEYGSGWGIVTDLEIGPDGYIYVSSLSSGKVFRIRPKVETITPNNFSMFRGSVVSGGLADLAVSDDSRLVMRPGSVFSTSEAQIQVILDGSSPFPNPSHLRFQVESHASSGNVVQTISLFNDDTQRYELLGTVELTSQDTVATVEVPSNAGRFVGSNGAIRARVNFKTTGTVFVFPWLARVDLTAWTITR
ncbi:MAG: PQQ-dependent sugar dehydrogenase [Fimbriimonadales bacterium]